MRIAVSLLLIVAASGCRPGTPDSDPAGGDSADHIDSDDSDDSDDSVDSGEPDDSDEPVDLDPLPPGADLHLGFSAASYHLVKGCPAQDLVYMRIEMTAPPSLDIEDVRLRAFELDGLSRKEGLDLKGSRDLDSPDVLAAGSTGVFSLSLKPDARVGGCEDSMGPTSMTRGVIVELDIHGTHIELSGELDVTCSDPAPHTC